MFYNLPSCYNVDNMVTKLSDRYIFSDVEEKFSQSWESSGVYSWRESEGSDFIIDTPPPTISGNLHMGHVYSYCHTDFIARYKRMRGFNVLYPMGFDDNGLPTERLVEKVRGIKAVDTARDLFRSICKDVTVEYRANFRNMFKSIGLSCDWQREYNTINSTVQCISQLSFIELYNMGVVYRKLQPMLWDTVDRTAIAQAEVEVKIFPSAMHTIEFEVAFGGKINIATTRPEMLPACVAVFYHPDDSRYSRLGGKYAIVPLFGTKVPIIADENVKIDKGTGLVMCCTFGDETDLYWWNRYNLSTRIIINQHGYMFDLGCERELASMFEGLKVVDARKKVVEVLNSAGLLVDSIVIEHAVKCAERSGMQLEILPTSQWFIKVLNIKEQLITKARKCNWFPESMRKRLELWIEGLNWDWCISRQRYSGVPFPVWYSRMVGEEGKVILPDISKLPIDPTQCLPEGYSADQVQADVDVMDTWATSSLTPQIVLGELRGDKFPVDLRPQSHEIIRSWAFYTLVKAYYHNDSVPWKNLMISGWCLAHDRTKMSKSRGNIIDPVSLLKTEGADVIRYWAASASLGADTTFSVDDLKVGKRLVTKLWNATKFVSLFFDSDYTHENITEPVDLWLCAKLVVTIGVVEKYLDVFDYARALTEVERFFWDDFCDNYLELVKGRAYFDNANNVQKSSARSTLSYTLVTILKLFAPFVPYVTEEIYQSFFPSKSVHARGGWCSVVPKITESKVLSEGENCILLLKGVRKIKADRNVSMRHPIEILKVKSPESLNLSSGAVGDLKSVCNIKEIVWDVLSEYQAITFEAVMASSGEESLG